jgi:hypothetical protein
MSHQSGCYMWGVEVIGTIQMQGKVAGLLAGPQELQRQDTTMFSLTTGQIAQILDLFNMMCIRRMGMLLHLK